ncbi:MAG: hypothetical protein AAGD05_16455, partial [Bacteroidota bacterium]
MSRFSQMYSISFIYRMVYCACCLLALSVWSTTLEAQETTNANDSLQQTELEQKMATMQDILESIDQLNQELEKNERSYKAAETEEGKNLISEQIKSINERLAQLDKDFTILSTGIDRESFFDTEEEELSWQEEIGDIFSPIIYELKQITAHSREMERLRNTIPYFERRIAQMELALFNIDTLNTYSENRVINRRLSELSKYWEGHRQEQQTELETMRLQLEKLEKEKKTFGEIAGEVSRVFFKSRGRNLLLAVLMFVFTFFSLRYIHKFIHRYTRVRRSQKRQFFLRLIDIVYYLFTIIASLGFFLMVLYLASDWVLLGLSVLLILGLIWASKRALPTFFEQAKLLLNLGAVREGERLLYKNVPYMVESLNIYTELVNPELEGGYVRLPIKDLI